MSGFAEERALGRVKGSRYAFKLGEHHAPEPDVAFVSASRPDLIEERWGNGAPDVAVEVVSRDSRTRDYVRKKSLYEETGVLEYWLVDPREDCAEFYRLRAGRYQLVPLVHDRFFFSEALPGFWLDIQWLLSPPRPSTLQCLQRILAGPPQ